MQLDPAVFKTDIARKLAEFVNAVLWVLARVPARRRPEPLIDLALIILCRSIRRLDSLTQRWKSGQLRPCKPRQRAARERDPARPLPPRAPSRNYWLPAIVQPVMQSTPYLIALMDAPETRALIAAAPQAGRIFRPLCRMFGLAIPEHLKLPARPPRVRKKPTPPEPRVDPDAHYRLSQVPPKWRLKVPGLNAPRLKNA